MDERNTDFGKEMNQMENAFDLGRAEGEWEWSIRVDGLVWK